MKANTNKVIHIVSVMEVVNLQRYKMSSSLHILISPQYEGLGWLWCCGGRGALEERRRQEKDKVLIAFTMWDTDGDGFLSWEEFQKISNNTCMSQEQAIRIFQHCDKVGGRVVSGGGGRGHSLCINLANNSCR